MDDKEVDFVCFKDGLVEYYQVAYQLPSDSDREERSLLNVAGIPIIHAVDWLLGI